jgi:hypothetical protein
MRKLLITAAALTIAVISQSQAAPRHEARSEFCDLAKNQRNVPSWNEYYKCHGSTARMAFAAEPRAAKPRTGPNSEFCELSKFQRNAPSWDEYYGCKRR